MAIPESIQAAIDAKLEESNGPKSEASVSDFPPETNDEKTSEAESSVEIRTLPVAKLEPEVVKSIAELRKKLEPADKEANIAEIRKESKKPEPKVKEFIVSPKTPSAEKLACVKEIGAILAAHGGIESNISMTDGYWKLVTKYRSL